MDMLKKAARNNPISLVGRAGYNLGKNLKLKKRAREEEAYRRAILQGAAEVVYCRVMLLGPGGVGKTSLKRGLMGLKFDCRTNSTIVAEVQSLKPAPSDWENIEQGLEGGLDPAEDSLSREWVTRSVGNEWKEVTEEDEIEELAQLIAYVDEVKEDTSVSGFEEDLSEYSSVSREDLTTIKSLMDLKILQRAFEQAKTIKIPPDNKPSPSPFLHVWDCGGQPVFQEVLPVFLTARTMFLLLFNATKDLNLTIESVQYRLGEKIKQGYVNMSTLQLLEGWMSNIHSYLLKKDKDGSYLDYPRIVPIGTRGDQLNDDEKCQVVDRLIESSYSKAFCKVLKHPIVIDNTTAGKGKGEDPNYQTLRDVISTFATRKLTELTPITWILYRKVLQLLISQSSDKNTISLNEARAIGMLCKVQPEDVHAVLKFYHELGVLLYFHNIDGLQNKIILNPKWFVECLGKVLTLPGIGKEEYERKLEWDLLRTKGLLVQPLYAAVWKECEGIRPDDLVQLLAMFQLAVEVKTNEYDDRNVCQFFVPAVLPYFTEDQQCHVAEGSLSAAPLHITFKSGYVTPGFFTRLITTMAKSPICSLYFDEGIFHNRVTYRFGEPAANLVTFTELSSMIAIYVRRFGPELLDKLQEDCLVLRSLCEVCSQSVEECLQPDREEHSSRIPRDIRVVCQQNECLSTGAGVHYLVSSPVSNKICCSREDKVYRQLTREEACWFQGVDLHVLKPTDGVLPDGSSENAVKSEPDPMDVFEQLKSKSLEWDEIGRSFRVSSDYREELKREGATTTNNSKLERIVIKWVESRCSEVSWNTVIEVLRSSGYMRLMEAVKEYLMNEPEAIRKYGWKDNDAKSAERSEESPEEFYDAPEPPVTTPTRAPELKDVLHFLKPESNHWDDIGRELGIELGYRRSLATEGIQSGDVSKLERVLNKWLESCDASWDTFIKALIELELTNVAKDVKAYLLNDNEGIQKYKWKDNQHP